MYRILLLVYKISGEECIEPYSRYIEYQEKNVKNPTLLVYRIPGEECIEPYSCFIEYQEKNV